MKLGVFTVPLGGMSLDEACAFLASHGVQMVEIGCGGCPGKAHDTRTKNPEQLLLFWIFSFLRRDLKDKIQVSM